MNIQLNRLNSLRIIIIGNIIGFCFVVLSLRAAKAQNHSDGLKLLFESPAKNWNEAVPIGNGRLGGMVYGGVNNDTIKINEETFWSGEPRDLQKHLSPSSMSIIRELIAQGKHNQAQTLIDSLMLGTNNQSYLPMGDLIFNFDFGAGIQGLKHYKRWLDLSRGVVKESFLVNGNRVKKEVFTSYPDDVMVVKIESDARIINLKASMTSQVKHSKGKEQGEFYVDGQAPILAFPHYLPAQEVVYEEGRGIRFRMGLRVHETDGNVRITNQGIEVESASYVNFIFSAGTSFNGHDRSPSSEGRNEKQLIESIIKRAREYSIEELARRHSKDYSKLFSRVSMFLGQNEIDENIPLGEKISAYKRGENNDLISLYYQFGRYLLISSSRPREFAQPANLQGLWSRLMQPAWSANWTLNCNAQINYWPVETANLAECHLPLVEFVKDLSEDGSKTARNLYNVNGWVAHHNADIWKTTSPVGGSGLWSIFQSGSGWLSYHLWEHYQFSGDKKYLKDVYPVILEAARFYSESLQENKVGHLITSPAVSFENQYKRPDGFVGWACSGPSQDMQIIRKLFEVCISTEAILGVTSELAQTLRNQLEILAPIQISPRTGRLQEWYEDWEAVSPMNGQMGHGWGLAVGDLITPRGTPELANAFKKSLEYRKPGQSYNSGSWTGSFPAMFYARLGDGDNALKVIKRHFEMALFPNFTSNFFDKYWMIDGNLGITAAIGELFLQSHAGEIELLPALPQEIPSGKIEGLMARGGLEIGMTWNSGELEEVRLKAKHTGNFKIRYKEITKTVRLNAGQSLILDGLFYFKNI